VDEGLRISVFRKRTKKFIKFYGMQNYHLHVPRLMELVYEHKAEEWRLLTDSSRVNLKVVFLSNWNEKPSIPVV
jgi:hypothetical protein